MIALPDANTLQAMGETLLIAGQRSADPPLLPRRGDLLGRLLRAAGLGRNAASAVNQPRWQSAVESVANVAIGFGVAVGAQVAIFPAFGFNPPLPDNLLIAAAFTVVSLARSFLVRRIFNRWHR